MGHPLSFKLFISKYTDLDSVTGHFSFLGTESAFLGWNDESFGKLWSYNLNYMDYLHQETISFEQAVCWIDKFVDEIEGNRNGLEPYPIALRGINWIKFLSKYHPYILAENKRKWDSSLYAQYQILLDNLEYHLLGNHLLEDAFSLLWAGLYFKDEPIYQKAKGLLLRELEEQLLPDGAHYEQSPMYHCILLDRLLDCYNVSVNNLRFIGQEGLNERLREKAGGMLGHLASVVYKDNTIPLLNDSAEGIAPSPTQLFAYAKRLDMDWEKLPMGACGYRKLMAGHWEAIVDVGDIRASYQPGHSHADDYIPWGPFFWFIALILMFICGCAGSTCGGLKMGRFVILTKNLSNEFKKQTHPHAVIPVRMNGHVVSGDIVHRVLAFVFAYITLIVVSCLALSLDGMGFSEAIGAAVSAISNVGPGLGTLGPVSNFADVPTVSKWFLSFLMLTGRLEIFTVLTILVPGFWKQ